MKEKYSVKDGRIEAVMWILCKEGKILIEVRPEDEAGESRCIPCGHIDLNRDKGDYIESAFIRESQEEFESGNFKPTKYEFLITVDFEEPKKDGSINYLKLHYFLVTEWTGEIPKYTIEHGKKHADLIWFPISKYKELPQSCDRKALEEVVRRFGN